MGSGLVGGLWGKRTTTKEAKHKRYHDAWCQTYIEVQEIGVQVSS